LGVSAVFNVTFIIPLTEYCHYPGLSGRSIISLGVLGTIAGHKTRPARRKNMKVKYFFIISAVVLLVTAIAFFVNAAWTLRLFDINLEPAGVLMTEIFGAALLGVAILNWLVRDLVYREDLRPILWANLIGTGASFIVLLVEKLNGLGNVYMWVVVALTGLATLAYGYYSFVPSAIEEPIVRPQHA
jgi:hypothetical protein